jgi:AcrR family transcriptional regulator
MTELSTPSTAAPRRGPAPTKHVDILWTAARLFAQQGIAQTSTRAIAADAGTTERTLFKHFGSKDGLVQAVMAQAVVPQLAPTSLEALRRAIDNCAGDLAGWHRALLQARSEAAAATPDLTRLLLVELLRDSALREQFGQAWHAAVWQPLQALFARLRREGRVRTDVPAPTLARLFLSLNIGYLVARHVLAPALPWDDDAEIAAIAAFFARGTAPG